MVVSALLQLTSAGAVWSRTVMVLEQVPVLPDASVARSVTVWLPICEQLNVFGLTVTDTSAQLSKLGDPVGPFTWFTLSVPMPVTGSIFTNTLVAVVQRATGGVRSLSNI